MPGFTKLAALACVVPTLLALRINSEAKDIIAKCCLNPGEGHHEITDRQASGEDVFLKITKYLARKRGLCKGFTVNGVRPACSFDEIAGHLKLDLGSEEEPLPFRRPMRTAFNNRVMEELPENTSEEEPVFEQSKYQDWAKEVWQEVRKEAVMKKLGHAISQHDLGSMYKVMRRSDNEESNFVCSEHVESNRKAGTLTAVAREKIADTDETKTVPMKGWCSMTYEEDRVALEGACGESAAMEDFSFKADTVHTMAETAAMNFCKAVYTAVYYCKASKGTGTRDYSAMYCKLGHYTCKQHVCKPWRFEGTCERE